MRDSNRPFCQSDHIIDSRAHVFMNAVDSKDEFVGTMFSLRCAQLPVADCAAHACAFSRRSATSDHHLVASEFRLLALGCFSQP